jgi:ABC-2 type transport system permease protein
MTAMAIPMIGQPSEPYRSRIGHNLTFGGLVKSEWVKLRSLRSIWWCAVLTVALSVGFTALLTPEIIGARGAGSAGQPASEGYAVSLAANGMFWVGQIVMSVLGALAVTSEYSSGSIRSTLSVAPRRGPALAAKMIVTGLFATAVAAVTLAGSLAVTSALLAGAGYEVEFGPDALKTSLGVIAYLTTAALVALGLGYLTRSSAGAIAISMGLYLVLPMIMMMGMGRDWIDFIIQILPRQAGELVVSLGSSSLVETPALGGYWGGMACLATWTVAALGAGYLVFKRRDA